MTDADILAIAAVLAGGACHSATGFGFVLVAGPLVVAAFPPEEAITSLLVLGILMSSLTLVTEGRRPDPLWDEARALLAWGAAGAVAGAFVLAELSATALQLLVTVTVLGTLLRRRTLRKGSDPFRRVEVAGMSA
ncbi:MAG: TSUP family transporter, partial [Thermoleophilaceae bacterium]